MHPGSCSRVITSIYGAVASPNAWPSALSSVAEALDAVGAGYIIRSKQSGRVEWACFSGPSAESSADYIGYYAALDPYRPLLDVAPSGDWVRLSRCLPKSILRRDEWYNDFVLKCGIKDMLGARLVDSEAHSAYL